MSTESPDKIVFSFRASIKTARQYQGELDAILGQDRVQDLLRWARDEDDVAFSYDMDVRGLEPGCAAFYSIARLFEGEETKTGVDKEQLERVRGIFADLLQSVERIKAVCDRAEPA